MARSKQTNTDKPVLFSTGEVARFFHVSAKTITTWHSKGKFCAGVTSPGGHRRFTATELRAELAKYGYPIPEELATAVPKDPGGEVLAVGSEASA